VLHGEQYLTLHRPLPPSRTVVGHARSAGLLDNGKGKDKDKGAVLYAERTITDKVTGARIATLTSAAVLRGDGGFGGKPGPRPEAPANAADVAAGAHGSPASLCYVMGWHQRGKCGTRSRARARGSCSVDARAGPRVGKCRGKEQRIGMPHGHDPQASVSPRELEVGQHGKVVERKAPAHWRRGAQARPTLPQQSSVATGRVAPACRNRSAH
jgi:hypothetical protein